MNENFKSFINENNIENDPYNEEVWDDDFIIPIDVNGEMENYEIINSLYDLRISAVIEIDLKHVEHDYTDTLKIISYPDENLGLSFKLTQFRNTKRSLHDPVPKLTEESITKHSFIINIKYIF